MDRWKTNSENFMGFIRSNSRQTGQSVMEFIVVMPMFFALLFGILEFTFIYKAKATLNTATFEAARAGSLNYGTRSYMVDALSKGMAPLYMAGESSAGMIGMTQAYGKSKLIASAMDLAPGPDPVKIINPTPEVIDAFAVERPIKVYSDGELKVRTFIPTDNLLFRSSDSIDVDIGGETFPINIQDANVLKIKTFWCYRMKTPLISAIIHEVVSGSFLKPASPEQGVCNMASLFDDGHYLAISSHAVMRMQTHFLKEGS